MDFRLLSILAVLIVEMFILFKCFTIKKNKTIGYIFFVGIFSFRKILMHIDMHMSIDDAIINNFIYSVLGLIILYGIYVFFEGDWVMNVLEIQLYKLTWFFSMQIACKVYTAIDTAPNAGDSYNEFLNAEINAVSVGILMVWILVMFLLVLVVNKLLIPALKDIKGGWIYFYCAVLFIYPNRLFSLDSYYSIAVLNSDLITVFYLINLIIYLITFSIIAYYINISEKEKKNMYLRIKHKQEFYRNLAQIHDDLLKLKHDVINYSIASENNKSLYSKKIIDYCNEIEKKVEERM